MRASRSSGPGGQHANVTASRIEAVFDVDGVAGAERRSRSDRLKARCGPRVTAVAQDARGQARNRELALRAAARADRGGGCGSAEAAPRDPADAARDASGGSSARSAQRGQREATSAGAPALGAD